MIYLDSAATTLIKPAGVEAAVLEALRTMSSPGRGGYESAMLAAKTVYQCREEAAALFNVGECERVVFCQNATHALNIAVSSVVKPGARVLTSGFEHNSVTRPLEAAGARITVAGKRLFDRDDTLRDFERNIKGKDAVVCTCVSNVFGYVLPVYEIADLCRENAVPLIVDASQAAGVLPVDFKRLHAAFVAMPGHKALFGPQGTGLLLCGERGEPLMHGGSGSNSVDPRMPDFLPDRLEAGTHNVCGIAGLLEGIRYVRRKGTASILAHEKSLLRTAVRELEGTDGIELFTGEDDSQCGVLSLRCARRDCEELAAALAERGICVRAGLHCAPYAHKSAGTLRTGTLRMSFSPFLTEAQVAAACGVIKEIS